MPSNLGYELSYLGTGGIIPLYPRTTEEQVQGYEYFGQVFGPFQLVLSQNAWVNKEQTLTLDGVLSTDILICDKVLSGTETQMQTQDSNYALLDPYTGIESLTGQVKFTCKETPSVDLTVQVSWVR